MKNFLSKVFKAGIIVCFVFALLAISSPVFAKPPNKPPGKPTSTITSTVTPTPTVRPSSVVQSQIRLTGEKLRVCQAHENVIQTRLQSLSKMANGMLSTFDTIAKRATEYYANTVVPGGNSVSNYDELVSAIQTKRSLVSDDLTVTQNDADNFLCTGIDPRGNLRQFRIDMQEVKKSLKEYRTAIKNLIVAVRTVVSEETPTPTGQQP